MYNKLYSIFTHLPKLESFDYEISCINIFDIKKYLTALISTFDELLSVLVNF